MLLTEYLSDVTKAIDEYSRTGLILSSELKTDARTEKIGLIKGSFVFINESKLFFTEYLDLRYKIEKLAYSLHYQDKNGELIFRYDNAAHKPDHSFKSHKHVEGAILETDIPNLKEVMEEILSCLLRPL
ncbi:MAG: hypothetical protein HQ547_04230 [Candidatus Omnitrophica bacterium]|nr:hypothetical protein [Candidatus Omnitrophota bacterium]